MPLLVNKINGLSSEKLMDSLVYRLGHLGQLSSEAIVAIKPRDIEN